MQRMDTHTCSSPSIWSSAVVHICVYQDRTELPLIISPTLSQYCIWGQYKYQAHMNPWLANVKSDTVAVTPATATATATSSFPISIPMAQRRAYSIHCIQLYGSANEQTNIYAFSSPTAEQWEPSKCCAVQCSTRPYMMMSGNFILRIYIYI